MVHLVYDSEFTMCVHKYDVHKYDVLDSNIFIVLKVSRKKGY